MTPIERLKQKRRCRSPFTFKDISVSVEDIDNLLQLADAVDIAESNMSGAEFFAEDVNDILIAMDKLSFDPDERIEE